MTADVELLPLPEPAFQLKWRNGAYYVSEPNIGNTDCYTADQVRANVAHATAAKDAELVELRSTIEALRAIAGCAYQMAGMHDAPGVWLDRLSQAANGDALPDPDTISDELLPYQPDAVCEAEAQAERLAEALRDCSAGLLREAKAHEIEAGKPYQSDSEIQNHWGMSEAYEDAAGRLAALNPTAAKGDRT